MNPSPHKRSEKRRTCELIERETKAVKMDSFGENQTDFNFDELWCDDLYEFRDVGDNNSFDWDPASLLDELDLVLESGDGSVQVLPMINNTLSTSEQGEANIDDDEDDDDDDDDDENNNDGYVDDGEKNVKDKRSSGLGSSKNFLSERNRRKRLNQQLFALRSLVPNITKMDKRSILVDALAYLKGILDETEKEMEKENGNTNSPPSSCTTTTTTEYDMPNYNHSAQANEISNKMPHTISEIDAEMIDEQSFVMKIRFGIGAGAAGQVQRVIESLRLNIISTTINQINEYEMLSTTLLSVKKKVAMTEEKLKDRVELISRKMGIIYLDV